jgi:hypothetical protein
LRARLAGRAICLKSTSPSASRRLPLNKVLRVVLHDDAGIAAQGGAPRHESIPQAHDDPSLRISGADTNSEPSFARRSAHARHGNSYFHRERDRGEAACAAQQ